MGAKKQQPESVAEKRGVLYVVYGKLPGETLKLRRDATIFGREKGDVLIEDTEVSSTHCQIQCINSVYHIFDMNSTNGTMVNNERVVKAKLKEGDLITIGKTTFKFGLEEEARLSHISTIFRSAHKTLSEGRTSVIESIIEQELSDDDFPSVLLEISYADGDKEKIELRQKSIFIGRASSFGRFDRDQELSRRHILIKTNETGEIFVEDQGSTNGSYINGKRITGMHQIRPADTIKIGSIQIKVQAIKAKN